ncbi:MAG: (Fe-S)-binding protein, partial [Candidatus Magnetominusculus sp. LBB02]|nr:(Fe-S)-binding protein [Candidatus Magnetominusculus sp. LBB02]
MSKLKQEDLLNVTYTPPDKNWMDVPTQMREGMYCHGAKEASLATVGFPNPRQWSAADSDWKLPENWRDTVLKGIAERLEKYRSFHIFMDICVR